MRARFTAAELKDAELVPGFTFTKGAPVLRVAGPPVGNPWWHGSLLFDLENDPQQQTPLRDDELELRMAELMVALMRANDAPAEQYERLGLPSEGAVLAEHLLVRRQWDQVQHALQPSVRRDQLDEDSPLRTLTLTDVLDRYPGVLPRHIVAGLNGMRRLNPSAPLLEVFAAHPGVTAEMMLEIDTALSEHITRKVS
jgi:hypothetical protein